MQQSDVPGKSPLVFGTSATGTYIRTVPQTTADPAAASFTLGFPPQTFTDEGAGGTPPDGRDFNGILNHLSGWCRWLMAGGPIAYDSAFQTAIGGYPLGAIVLSTVTAGLKFRSITENNTTNPDSGGAGWVKVSQSGSNANGYWRFLDDGSLEQWGYALTGTLANGASTIWSAPLPVAFPTAMTGASATLGNAGVGTGSAATAMDVGTPFLGSTDTVLPVAAATTISGFAQNNSGFSTKMLIRWSCIGK